MRKHLLFILFSILIGKSFAQNGYSSILEKLPILKTNSIEQMDDSHDPAGRNLDGYQYGNFKYVQTNQVAGDFSREYVLCDLKGPGKIDRIWMTWIDSSSNFRVYIDGELVPSINVPYYTFFNQANMPLQSPISEDFYSGSGAYYSYLPITFQHSIKLTLTYDSTVYYQIGYTKFVPDTIVESFNINNDFSDLKTLMTTNGINPKTNGPYNFTTQTFQLSPQQSKIIYSGNTPSSIEEIKLKIPDLDFYYDETIITDDGRGYNGNSKFTLKIDGNADSIVLIRRIDFQSGGQKGKVFIDNVLVGTWLSPVLNTMKKFGLVYFNIPKSYYQGKNTINIKVVDEASGSPFNEFYYWIRCNNTTTDSLDVGNIISELTHAYTVTNQKWYTTLTNKQLTPEEIRLKNETILKNIYLKIKWDDEAIPSVYCPIGYFFGIGTLDAVHINSVAMGVNDSRDLYVFWSMPFEKKCEISIENKGINTINNITSKIGTKAYNSSFDRIGKFTVVYNQNTTTDSVDYNYGNIAGWGKLVGTVLQAENPEKNLWLEGDERFTIDNNKTPLFHGTGTEDYFNGGFYFFTGTYNKAFSGLSAQFFENRSMYRLHILDPIDFLLNGAFNQEHGEYNNWNVSYNSAIFLYKKETPKMQLSDSLVIENAIDKLNHQYYGNGISTQTTKGMFEGDNDDIDYTLLGHIISDSSCFTASILPQNEGVRLQRVFDYSIKNQACEVWVDGQKVGIWYSAGQNNYKKWREEFFQIPSSFTQNKTTIKICLKNKGQNSYTSISYRIYTILKDATVSGITHNNQSFGFQIYPNPSTDFIQIKIDDTFFQYFDIAVIDIKGEIVMTQNNVNTQNNAIDIKNLPAGTYFLEFKSGKYKSSLPFIKINN